MLFTFTRWEGRTQVEPRDESEAYLSSAPLPLPRKVAYRTEAATHGADAARAERHRLVVDPLFGGGEDQGRAVGRLLYVKDLELVL